MIRNPQANAVRQRLKVNSGGLVRVVAEAPIIENRWRPCVENERDELREWSVKDDVDLSTHIEQGRSVEEIARLLARPPQEVRERLGVLTREGTSLFPRDVAAS